MPTASDKHSPFYHHILLFLSCGLLMSIVSLSAWGCDTISTPSRVALLELYTSEGCNSCPPADRWLSGIQGRGIGPGRLVPLAFHVDYWDYIGWKDRFADARYSARQRLIAERNNASVIYTPQFVLDGRDFRRPWLGGALDTYLNKVNQSEATVHFRVRQQSRQNALDITVESSNRASSPARFFVVVFQNGQHTEVKAGENAGKKLYHEFVVRQLAGPFDVSANGNGVGEVLIDLAQFRKPSDLGIAVFAENSATGEVLNAIATPICESALNHSRNAGATTITAR